MKIIEEKEGPWDAEDNILVDSISDLKKVFKQRGVILVRWHTIKGDGGSGVFTYDATVPRSTANNGTIIDPTDTGVGTGCWIREYSLDKYSLSFYGLANSKANLTAEVGVQNAVVYIAESGSGHAYVFDSTKVLDHNGETNIHGWIIQSSAYTEQRRIFYGASYVNQAPASVDNPIQLTFGPAQGTATDPVMIDAAGAITFNVAGVLPIDAGFHISRSTSTGTAKMFLQAKLNGVAIENSVPVFVAEVDESKPARFSSNLPVTAGDILTIELVRDSTGADDGGLIAVNPVVGDFNPAPSCFIAVSQYVTL